MVTISVIKADIGGFPGHSFFRTDVGIDPMQEIFNVAVGILERAKNEGKIKDFRVMYCGDDLQLIMSHYKGVENPEIHGLAWDVFKEAANKAKELKLYGAGQDILSEAFSGNLRGMGPGIAEMEFEERKSEPFIVFMADKTEPGAWNYILYKIFADPFNTPGLVIDPHLHDGFVFEVWDLIEHKKVKLNTPEELYDLLALIGGTSRYVIKRVYKKNGEIAAVASTERLSMMAGRYVGKDDPVLVVRAQHGFPAQGEVLEPFAFPHLVKGWMRGSHHGPLMPVSFKNAHPTRFDGPPRVIAAGFHLVNGILIGPADLFNDPAFDRARNLANKYADYLRQHGPFEPHRLGLDEMEYTTLPGVMEKLKNRFEPL